MKTNNESEKLLSGAEGVGRMKIDEGQKNIEKEAYDKLIDICCRCEGFDCDICGVEKSIRILEEEQK